MPLNDGWRRQRTADHHGNVSHPVLMMYSSSVCRSPRYCAPSFHSRTKSAIVRILRSPSNASVLFGTVGGRPRSRLGFHRKKELYELRQREIVGANYPRGKPVLRSGRVADHIVLEHRRKKAQPKRGMRKESPTIILNQREFVSTPLRSLRAAERFQRLYHLLCPLRHLVIAQGAFG